MGARQQGLFRITRPRLDCLLKGFVIHTQFTSLELLLRRKTGKYIFISGEHMINFPIVKETYAATPKVVLDFCKDEIVSPLGVPTTVLSYKTT